MANLVLMSHSQRSSFLRCANQFRLRKGGFPTKPSLSLIGGSAFHTATDTVDAQLWAGEVPNEVRAKNDWLHAFLGEVEDAYKREPDDSQWQVSGRRTKDKPNKEDLIWWREAGAAMVVAYVAGRLAEINRGIDIWALPDGSPAIEVAFEFQLGGTLQRGKIDRIMADTATNEPVLIRDEKTSQREPDDTSQLGLYRVAMQRTFGVDIEWGDYFMARTGQATTPVSLAHYTAELFEHEAGMVALAKQHQIYPANPGSSCISCDVRDACAIKGGVLANEWLKVMPK